MASIFTWLRRRLSAAPASPAAEPAEHYQGYRIRPTPFARRGQFQLSGIIERDIDGETKEHRFIRADAYPNRNEAAAFSIAKAKQIIDEQGDRMFR